VRLRSRTGKLARVSTPPLPAYGDQGRIRNWFHTKPGARFLNRMTAWFKIRAPRGYGALTTRGRRSGRQRTACVRAVVSGRRAILVATGGRTCDWLPNIEAEPHVSLRLGGATLEGRGRPAAADETHDLAEAFCRKVYLFDRVSFVVNQRGIFTASRIRSFHDRWCREGSIVVVEFAT
jgi:deazaflavin-dependent oxidoreductase (nitroreductase family)